VLSGTQIYSTDLLTAGDPLVTSTWQLDPAGASAWSDFRITFLDHAATTPADGRFGNDYLAGGAGSDVIFGQLGDDVIQGDGSIDLAVTGVRVTAYRDAAGDLVVRPSVEGAGDGDDYIEGNGGADVIFGGLGRDDIVGGSSDLYSLTTQAARPDRGDLIFGGAGTDVQRNDQSTGHGLDSDTIVGDNGDILRLVSTGTGVTAYRTFTYDSYGETVRLLPRAVRQLDYTAGGPDRRPDLFAGMNQTLSATSGTMTVDVWGADEIHAESGDDTVYAGGGDDVVFGDAGDDDLVGGWGHDWISGGTGTDGLLGDDGRIFTSRNGLTEPLNGVTVANVQRSIATPGSVQTAVLYPTGALFKSVDLTPWALNPKVPGGPVQSDDPLYAAQYADDLLFGGLGDDFMHGGGGNDGMSGAEALPTAYAPTVGGVVRSDWNRPRSFLNILRFGVARGGMFDAYDEYDPMRQIGFNADGSLNKTGDTTRPWLLNHAAGEGPATGTKFTDGNDVLFGDYGNDWLTGGTGKDTLWGGWGNDLLNADDDLTTHGGLNDQPDTDASYEDRAVGGAGVDVLIANTGGDRLIDWVGEFNSYLVPFAPFGLGTVSRQVLPGLYDFLYDLSEGQGADQTLVLETGAASAPRNGEPFGEIGLVVQQDPFWQDQTGGPRDPQPGNVPGGQRDVLRSADFNATTTLDGFFVDSGSFAISGGALTVTATGLGGDAAAVFYADEYLPVYYELAASILVKKPTGGWKANAFMIFDYFGPLDFKFAGIDVSTNKLVIGHRTASGWIYDVQATPRSFKADTSYDLLLAVNGTAVTLAVNGTMALSYTYAARLVDGQLVGLNKGLTGMGSNNSRGVYDNVQLRVLAPVSTFDLQLNLVAGTSTGTGTGSLGAATAGTWTSTSTGLVATPPSAGTALLPFGFGTVTRLSTSAWVELTATLVTGGIAGIVFDSYGVEDYKFAGVDVAGQRLVIGHVQPRGGWRVDASVAFALGAATAYTLVVTLKGASVSLTVNGAYGLSFGFNGGVSDGGVGLFARGATARFTAMRVRTDDPVFLSTTGVTTTGTTSTTTATLTSGSSSGALEAFVAQTAASWSQLATPSAV